MCLVMGTSPRQCLRSIQSRAGTSFDIGTVQPGKPRFPPMHLHMAWELSFFSDRMIEVWKPVAYASSQWQRQSVDTETECRYSQSEKEALALVKEREKFEDYILGKEIQLETDHKPLVPLLQKTHLHCLPPRILHFCLRLMRFSYAILHVPGALHCWCTITCLASNIWRLSDQANWAICNTVVSTLPASTEWLQEYCTAQLTDTNCAQLVDLCRNGWPNHKHQVPENVCPYWSVWGELSLQGDLFLHGRQIAVP